MNRPEPYIAISRAPRGTYAWALDQLAAGNYMRRACWPIEVRSATYTAIWKLYPSGYRSICQGFSPNCVGADNDSWGDLGMDSGQYYPTVEDQLAHDWQFDTDVTAADIEYHDKHRLTVWPNVYVQEWQRRNRITDHLWAMLFAVAFIATVVFFALGKFFPGLFYR